MGLLDRRGTERAEAGDEVERPTPAFEVGAPGRCPVCDGFGYIDYIDMVNRVQVQHCRQCRHRWEFSFDEDGELIDLRDGVADASPAPHLRSAPR